MGKPQKVQILDSVPVSTHARLSDYLLLRLQNWPGILTKQALFSWDFSIFSQGKMWRDEHEKKKVRQTHLTCRIHVRFM